VVKRGHTIGQGGRRKECRKKEMNEKKRGDGQPPCVILKGAVSTEKDPPGAIPRMKPKSMWITCPKRIGEGWKIFGGKESENLKADNCRFCFCHRQFEHGNE